MFFCAKEVMLATVTVISGDQARRPIAEVAQQYFAEVVSRCS